MRRCGSRVRVLDSTADDVESHSSRVPVQVGCNCGIPVRTRRGRVAGWLADRGITGSLVLVVGDEFGPSGSLAGRDSSCWSRSWPARRGVGWDRGRWRTSRCPPLGGGCERLLEILDDQLARRSTRRVPWIDEDPAWVVPLPAEPAMERAAEALGTLANGWAAIRGSREEGGAGSAPLFAVNGLYAEASPRNC